MLIVGAFEHSIELEQALGILEQEGIPRKSIMVVPMDTEPLSGLHYVDKSCDLYFKAGEAGMAVATAAAVIGMSRGFISKWGPIFEALFFAFVGFLIGSGIYLLVRKNKNRRVPEKLPEVVVIVQCEKGKAGRVKEIMWKYRSLSVGEATG